MPNSPEFSSSRDETNELSEEIDTPAKKPWTAPELMEFGRIVETTQKGHMLGDGLNNVT